MQLCIPNTVLIWFSRTREIFGIVILSFLYFVDIRTVVLSRFNELIYGHTYAYARPFSVLPVPVDGFHWSRIRLRVSECQRSNHDGKLNSTRGKVNLEEAGSRRLDCLKYAGVRATKHLAVFAWNLTNSRKSRDWYLQLINQVETWYTVPDDSGTVHEVLTWFEIN